MASVFTIGHSNRAFTDFLGVLTAHEVEIVADVRSYPASRYAPQFNRKRLASFLEANGIGYVFMGAELGGRPKEAEYYDAEGRVRYAKLARSQRFKSGLERLTEMLQEERVAIMCSEENPVSCHRRLLVGRELQERGIEALHLRADGSAQAEGDLGASAAAGASQLRLFEASVSPDASTGARR